MATSITPEEERSLFTAIEKTAELVRSGSDPNDAVEKVARELSLRPGQISLVSYAYNTGRQNSQWQGNGTILDKLAAFPLADPDEIVRRIYGGGQKQAAAATDVAAEYAAPPSWRVDPQQREKAAAAFPVMDKPTPYVRETAFDLHKAYGTIDRERHALAKLASDATAASDAVLTKIAALVEYFRQPSYSRLGFATVEKAAATYYGEAGKSLLDLVYERARLGARKEARAKDTPIILKEALDRAAPPFTLMDDCMTAARQSLSSTAALATGRQKAATVKEAALRPFSIAGASANGSQPKTAGLLTTPAAGAAIGTALSRGVSPKPRNELINDAMLDLSDPSHQNELRKIRAHAMINGLLTDPDDPISGHDPDKVLAAYNEIAAATPRLAETTATLRPALRRMLEGHGQPFEAKELLDIEKGIQSSRTPLQGANLMPQPSSPDKLF